jgi:hypothetical protein
MEKRECRRFEVFGAELSYRVQKRFFKPSAEEGVDAPVCDISYGGVRFLSDAEIKTGRELALDLRIPGENGPLHFKGKVAWVAPHPGPSYRYEIGVQFHPYGGKKGFNPPENLDRLKAIGRSKEEQVQKAASEQGL